MDGSPGRPPRKMKPVKPRPYAVTLALAVLAVLLVTGIVTYPEQAFQASLKGLSIWWNIVFPAMLPFLILAEIMIAFGVMHFFGVWLDPLMRRGFRLPGESGVALSMSAMCGYPAGARTAAVLREKGLLTREEGERLLAVSFMCSPVFVIAVVGIGFFRSASFGWMLFVLHMASWLVTALIYRMFSGKDLLRDTARLASSRDGNLLNHSLQAMNRARREDGRSFGKLLGDSVTQSVQTMLMVGGFMMLFSVILEIADASGLVPAAAGRLQTLVRMLGLPEHMILPGWAGFMEIHLGTQAAGAAEMPPSWQAALAGAVLAWGGLSVHAQVKSLTASTGLSLALYLKTRMLHALTAFILTLALWKPLLYWSDVIRASANAEIPARVPEPMPNLWLALPGAAVWGAAVLLALLLGSWIVRTMLSSK